MAHDTLSNLPAPRTTLFGRAAELDLLVGRLLSAPGRLLTITGPGGVGKTSLALALARQMTPDFEHGAWMADLSAITTPGDVPKAIAEELVITVGTAGVHVEHILRKLDLQSRHQVADWARARGLVTD